MDTGTAAGGEHFSDIVETPRTAHGPPAGRPRTYRFARATIWVGLTNRNAIISHTSVVAM